MPTKMLPCPFCGKKADLDDPDTLYPSGIFWRDGAVPGMPELRTYHRRQDRQEGDGVCYAMHCPTPAGGCGAEIMGDSKEEVIEAWNRRVPAAAKADAEVQGLLRRIAPLLEAAAGGASVSMAAGDLLRDVQAQLGTQNELHSRA